MKIFLCHIPATEFVLSPQRPPQRPPQQVAQNQIRLNLCDLLRPKNSVAETKIFTKILQYSWLPSIQSFSTFLELRLRSGAWSSFLDLSSEYDEICSVYVPLCDEVQLKKRMILNENWLLKAAGKLCFQLLTSRCLTNSEMTMGPVHQGVFWTFVPMQGKTRRDRLLVIQQDKLINPLVSLSIQLTSLVKNSTMTLNPSEVTGYDMVLDIGTVFCFSLQWFYWTRKTISFIIFISISIEIKSRK